MGLGFSFIYSLPAVLHHVSSLCAGAYKHTMHIDYEVNGQGDQVPVQRLVVCYVMRFIPQSSHQNIRGFCFCHPLRDWPTFEHLAQILPIFCPQNSRYAAENLAHLDN